MFSPLLLLFFCKPINHYRIVEAYFGRVVLELDLLIIVDSEDSKASLVSSVASSMIVNDWLLKDHISITTSYTFHNRYNVPLALGVRRLKLSVFVIWKVRIYSVVLMRMTCKMKDNTCFKHGLVMPPQLTTLKSTSDNLVVAYNRIVIDRYD
jgi:hypothetical protein